MPKPPSSGLRSIQINEYRMTMIRHLCKRWITLATWASLEQWSGPSIRLPLDHKVQEVSHRMMHIRELPCIRKAPNYQRQSCKYTRSSQMHKIAVIRLSAAKNALPAILPINTLRKARLASLALVAHVRMGRYNNYVVEQALPWEDAHGTGFVVKA